jgi:hypothetical protein
MYDTTAENVNTTPCRIAVPVWLPGNKLPDCLLLANTISRNTKIERFYFIVAVCLQVLFAWFQYSEILPSVPGITLTRGLKHSNELVIDDNRNSDCWFAACIDK